MKFIRTTHCECGKPKVFTKEEQTFWDNTPKASLICHLLDPKKPMTFIQIKDEADIYQDTHGDENYLSLEDVALALISLANWNFAKVV